MYRSFNTLWKQLAKYSLKRALRDVISIPSFGHLVSGSLFIDDYLLCAAGYSFGYYPRTSAFNVYFLTLFPYVIVITFPRDKIKRVYLYIDKRERLPAGIPPFVVSCTGFLRSRFYARNTFPASSSRIRRIRFRVKRSIRGGCSNRLESRTHRRVRIFYRICRFACAVGVHLKKTQPDARTGVNYGRRGDNGQFSVQVYAAQVLMADGV
jgi:hypothetical protein